MLRLVAVCLSLVAVIAWICFVAGTVTVLTDPSVNRLGALLLAVPLTAGLVWLSFWLLESTTVDF